jgi:hypothetical protein
MEPLSAIRSRGPYWAADVAAILVLGLLCYSARITPTTCVAVILAVLGFGHLPRNGPPPPPPPDDEAPSRRSRPPRRPPPPAGLATAIAGVGVLARRVLHLAHL